MFSYYGSKSKIVKKYSKPEYDTIIEPFAGAAWYSSTYKEKNVILNEKYDILFGIWNWLINDARPDEILEFVDFFLGENINNLLIEKAHKDLLGFCINRGSSVPANIVGKWNCQVKSKPNWASTTSFQLKRIAKNLPLIKHWEIIKGDYTNLPDIEATWFIDPPYQFGGQYYKENKIDYNELTEWCKSRKGQVIVCENMKADWLPFEPLVIISGQKHKTTEAIWTNQ
jgi:site-specific DNA-adenine methylase